MKRIISKTVKIFDDLLFSLNINPKYECPFCHGRFRKFLPHIDIPAAREKIIVGMGYREHCYCPRCHSKDRERLVFLYLNNKTDLFTQKVSLLHIAPENNLKNELMRKINITYLSADLNMESVMVKMDIRDINYTDEFFDVIICNHVLQYIDDDLKAIGEFYRVLKPGGWAILQVPISLLIEKTYENVKAKNHEEEERVFGDRGVVRLYSKDYKNRLEQIGFNVEEFNWKEFISDFGGSINKYGLIANELLYIAHK